MLAEVVVERVDGGTVVLRWTWAGTQRAPVDVLVITPDGRTTPGATGVTAGSVRVTAAVHPRHLFTVRAAGGPEVVAAERRLAVDGTLNFRDLGGYLGDGGRAVRWGRVFRSDNLAAVGTSGWQTLAGLGLRNMFDLRHAAERDRAPTMVPPGTGLSPVHLPIGGEAAEAPDLVELLRADPGRYGMGFMVDMYRTLLADHARLWGRLLTALSAPQALPAVFHCTAGKDRTGVAAALLLGALGVDRATILDDYELTTELRSRIRIEQLRPQLEEAGVEVDAVRHFLSAPRPAMEAALAEVDDRFGGIEGYLAAVAGVDEQVVNRLRAELLSPRST